MSSTQVTKMAYSMVAVYGMDKELGLLSYGQNNSSQQFYKPYSSFVHKKKISRNHWIPKGHH